MLRIKTIDQRGYMIEIFALTLSNSKFYMATRQRIVVTLRITQWNNRVSSRTFKGVRRRPLPLTGKA